MESIEQTVQRMQQSKPNGTNTPAGSPSTTTSIEDRVTAALREQFETMIAQTPGAAVCPMCAGLGCVSLNLPPDHALFGRAFTCPCQAETIAQRRLASLFQEHGIPPSHQDYSFQAWTMLPAEIRERKRLGINACQRLARDGSIRTKMGVTKCGVVLSGEPGMGKSSLAAATAIEFGSQGKAVLWKDFNDFIENVQETYSSNYRGPSRKQLTDAVARSSVLIFDDMGGFEADDKITRDKRDITYAVIRERYHRRLLTVITTNLGKEDFKEQFGKRINRRVRECYLWVDLAGDDLSAY